VLSAAWRHGRFLRVRNRASGCRRIGVLIGQAADDPQGKPRVAAFLQGLQQLGWTEGRNVQIDIRWGAADAASSRRYAAEMIALAPDVILTGASTATAAVQEATRTLPIVFVNVSDPVGAGYVASLAAPSADFARYSISANSSGSTQMPRCAIFFGLRQVEDRHWSLFSLRFPQCVSLRSGLKTRL
jgi:ABC transporter substrate binding protein